jgi:hypothetical protein
MEAGETLEQIREISDGALDKRTAVWVSIKNARELDADVRLLLQMKPASSHGGKERQLDLMRELAPAKSSTEGGFFYWRRPCLSQCAFQKIDLGA